MGWLFCGRHRTQDSHRQVREQEEFLGRAECRWKQEESDTERTTAGQPSIASFNRKAFEKKSKPSPLDVYWPGNSNRSYNNSARRDEQALQKSTRGERGPVLSN